MKKLRKSNCTFESIEYFALKDVLNAVGMRVEGAGPYTDRLRLVVETAKENDGFFIIELDDYDLRLLRAFAKIADGLNDILTVAIFVDDQPVKRSRINAAEALLETLTEFMD